MTTNQRTLLELISSVLFVLPFDKACDLETILDEAYEQKILSLLSKSIQSGISNYSKEQTNSYYIKIAYDQSHYVNVVYEQSQLVDLLKKQGIPNVILKGTAAAMYYPIPYLRTMGDVDFIVPDERFDDARLVLEDNGYYFQRHFGDDRDYEYIKNGVIFELHHHFSKDPVVEKLVQDGIKNAVLGSVNEYGFPCLPPAENGLVILDHIRHHFKTSGIGLRHLIDWMMYAHSVLTDDFWQNKFQPIAKEAGLERFAIVLTATCQKWFGMPDSYSWCQGVDDDLTDQTIDIFLANGNFGRKQDRKSNKVGNVTAEIKSKGRFRYLQSTGEMTWKALDKHPKLKHFAWFYQLCRFAKRGLIDIFNNKKFKKELSEGLAKGDYYRRIGI